jgi:hypothetical protein
MRVNLPKKTSPGGTESTDDTKGILNFLIFYVVSHRILR